MEAPTFESTKSDSGSKRRRRHKRYNEVKLTTPDDLKYLWAGYRKGSLDEVHPVFEEEMSQDEFRISLQKVITENGWTAWTLISETGQGFMPVGVVLAWVRGRIIELSNMVWFPWASPRNIWESSLNYFDSIRKVVVNDALEISDPLRYPVVLEFARHRDKGFFERISDKGIMRRVGTVVDLYPRESCAMFQTRSPVK